MTKVPAGIYFCGKMFRSRRIRGRTLIFRISVLLLTFLSYAALHACRKALPVVKKRLQGKCDFESKICVNGFGPFENIHGQTYFFILDISWSTAYALGMLAMGYAAERLGKKLFLVISLFGTSVCAISFGLGYFYDIQSFYYYFYLQILNGVFQSAGWPTIVPIVSSWIPKKAMGSVMGIWGNHYAIGNIVGQTISSAFVDDEWGFGFVFNGLLCALVGLFVIFFLVSKPFSIEINQRDLENNQFVNNNSRNLKDSFESGEIIDSKKEKPVGFIKALFLPGVLEFAFSLFFCKIVIYTFLFWLPFYINEVGISNIKLTAAAAGLLSTLFDVGGIIGNIVTGFIMDKCRAGGILVFCLQMLSAISIFLFSMYGNLNYNLCVAMLLLAGFFVNSPNSLITGTISASLSDHPKLKGNKKGASVITAIVDGIGCMGAVAAPILVKKLSIYGWNYIMYALIASCILSGILLLRQICWEIQSFRA